MKTSIADLEPGQPLKYRNAGYTNDGLRKCKLIFNPLLFIDS